MIDAGATEGALTSSEAVEAWAEFDLVTFELREAAVALGRKEGQVWRLYQLQLCHILQYICGADGSPVRVPASQVQSQVQHV